MAMTTKTTSNVIRNTKNQKVGFDVNDNTRIKLHSNMKFRGYCQYPKDSVHPFGPDEVIDTETAFELVMSKRASLVEVEPKRTKQSPLTNTDEIDNREADMELDVQDPPTPRRTRRTRRKTTDETGS